MKLPLTRVLKLCVLAENEENKLCCRCLLPVASVCSCMLLVKLCQADPRFVTQRAESAFHTMPRFMWFRTLLVSLSIGSRHMNSLSSLPYFG